MTLGFVRCLLAFLANTLLYLPGLFIVAIALPFRTVAVERQQFTQYPDYGYWQLVRLPKWALWFDNPCDGMLGDMRGWWDNYCRENYGKDCRAFYSMWQWAALRNPTNYFGRVVTGVDQARCMIEKLAGGKYWQLLKGIRDDGKVYPLFEGEIPYGNGKGLEWRFGWKLDMDKTFSEDDPIEDRFMGCVFRLRPWVTL